MAATTHIPSNPVALELHDRLDLLWSQYLSHLATYQSAQEATQKQFSKAFFALAQANFNKASGRYGRDQFGGRAVAALRAKLVTTAVNASAGDRERIEVAIHARPLARGVQSKSTEKAVPSNDEVPPMSAENETETVASSRKLTVEQLLTPEATPEPYDAPYLSEKETSTERTPDSSSDKDDSSDQEEPQPTDPLSTFAGGILIPPSLRKAKDAFSALFLEDSQEDTLKHGTNLIRAINAARSMVEVETEIRRLRKQIRKAERAGNQE